MIGTSSGRHLGSFDRQVLGAAVLDEVLRGTPDVPRTQRPEEIDVPVQ
jgi:hypothetical protein